MNEHAGRACALSALIVGAFAILLHDRDRPASSASPTGPVAARTWPDRPSTPPPSAPKIEGRPSPVATPKAPEPASIEPPRPASEPAPVPAPVPKPTPEPRRAVPRPEPSPAPPSTPSPAPRPTPTPTPPDRPGPSPAIPAPVGPRPPFATVGPGETLADIAARVYGRGGSAEALWKANRDQVARVDSPLTPGTLLRTP